jgi:hypothetical protein
VSPAVVGKLGSAEFALLTFKENKGRNPQLDIGRLKELVQFRGIKQQHWLTVAKKSIFPTKILKAYTKRKKKAEKRKSKERKVKFKWQP